MPINREEAAKVAQLARLALTEAELQLYTRQLDSILAYVEALKALDVTGVDPMISAACEGNVFRTDEVRPSLKREDALSAAPQQDGEFFQVPPVIE